MKPETRASLLRGFFVWLGVAGYALQKYIGGLSSLQDWDWFEFSKGAVEVSLVGVGMLVKFFGGDLPDKIKPDRVEEKPEKPDEPDVLFDDDYAPEITIRKQYAWQWGERSLKRMEGVHDDIVTLLTVALKYSPYDAGIAHLGGVRTMEQQQELLDQGGVTTIKNSRHLHGLALDVLMYDERGVYTTEWKYYAAFEEAVAHASRLTGIPYTWGGTWTSPKDLAHFELPRDRYPDTVDYKVAA